MRLLACAALALLSSAAVATAAPHDDRHFLNEALQGDNSEIQLGALAMRRASSPAVRDYGRMLNRDHAAAKRDALRVARAYGVRDTGRIIPEAAAEKRRLMRLGGRAFDREFVRYMVEDHHKDISDFREHAAGRSAVAELARRTLPVLERHLQTAERLAGAH